MHKKFEINRTKMKGGCQSGRKVVPYNSKSDLPLVMLRRKCHLISAALRHGRRAIWRRGGSVTVQGDGVWQRSSISGNIMQPFNVGGGNNQKERKKMTYDPTLDYIQSKWH